MSFYSNLYVCHHVVPPYVIKFFTCVVLFLHMSSCCPNVLSSCLYICHVVSTHIMLFLMYCQVVYTCQVVPTYVIMSSLMCRQVVYTCVILFLMCRQIVPTCFYMWFLHMSSCCSYMCLHVVPTYVIRLFLNVSQLSLLYVLYEYMWLRL